MKNTWMYHDKQYWFDVSEVGCMERITRALELLRAQTDKDTKKVPPYTALAAHCEIIQAFFTTVFGETAAAEICGNLQSGEKYTTAFLSFILFVREQAAEIERMIASAEERYLQKAGAMGVCV